MKCATCGKENRATAGFCAWCGARLPQSQDNLRPPSDRPADTPDDEAPFRALDEVPVPALPPASSQEEPADVTPAEDQAQAAQNEFSATQSGPLRPGDIVGERYEILELVESNAERNQYRALDRRRCAACGFDENDQEDPFCAECGASLAKPAYVLIVEQVPHPSDQFDRHFTEGEREYFVKAQPLEEEAKAQETAGTEHPALRLAWGRATDDGLTRDHNEDYLEGWTFSRGSGGLLGLFVVADGLGGQDSGEVASRLATDTLWQSLRESVWEPTVRGEQPEPEVVRQALEQAVRAANQQVYNQRVEQGSQMSTTLTVAMVVDATAYIANVGDSRTYLFNAGGLRQITKDHSLVQRLVDTGQLAREEVYTHPQRNLIYQSIGDRPEVQMDQYTHSLASDDRLILCSDGLWEMVRENGLEEVLLAEVDPQRACDRLVQNANLAGGEDNISVIIVQALPA
ncbi:MAG: Stp1/IreP family PP2C-type Ser/Thr phosphatase [Anaerolineae bacterium]